VFQNDTLSIPARPRHHGVWVHTAIPTPVIPTPAIPNPNPNPNPIVSTAGVGKAGAPRHHVANVKITRRPADFNYSSSTVIY